MLVVGEAWGEQEELQGLPFVGPSGWLLKQVMQKVGIAPQDVSHMTNVFNLRPERNNIESLCASKEEGVKGYGPLAPGKYVRAEYEQELARLKEELHAYKSDLVLALGSTALWALTGNAGIAKRRGYLFETKDGQKCLATWHPAMVLRNYKLMPTFMMDLAKARQEMGSPHIHKTTSQLFVPSPDDRGIEELMLYYLVRIAPAPYVVCDIETEGGTITEIGFAISSTEAVCIPFFRRPNESYWPNAGLEAEAWRMVKQVCESKRLVGQNFAYDMKYLWQAMGIACNNWAHDTMLMHHTLEPELEKGLGYLASMYTNRPAWKFMRQESKTDKKGD